MACAGVTMLTSPTGSAYSSKHLGSWFSKLMDKAGLRKERGLTLHGLRVSAAGRLAEAGATDMEVMAITGHRTIRMVQHYTRGARQKVLGLQAIQKLEDQS